MKCVKTKAIQAFNNFSSLILPVELLGNLINSAELVKFSVQIQMHSWIIDLLFKILS